MTIEPTENGEDAEKSAIVQRVDGWSLITYGAAQVSVDAHGLLWLPRLVDPADIDDFTHAVLAAGAVGRDVAADDAARRDAAEQGSPLDGPVHTPHRGGEAPLTNPRAAISRRR